MKCLYRKCFLYMIVIFLGSLGLEREEKDTNKHDNIGNNDYDDRDEDWENITSSSKHNRH